MQPTHSSEHASRAPSLDWLPPQGYPDAAALPTAHPPFLEQDGQRVGGSRPIIQHLAATGTVPAALLHPTALGDRAAALALARMCDTDLAAALVYYRWVDDEVGFFVLGVGVGGRERVGASVKWAVVASRSRRSHAALLNCCLLGCLPCAGLGAVPVGAGGPLPLATPGCGGGGPHGTQGLLHALHGAGGERG